MVCAFLLVDVVTRESLSSYLPSIRVLNHEAVEAVGNGSDEANKQSTNKLKPLVI